MGDALAREVKHILEEYHPWPEDPLNVFYPPRHMVVQYYDNVTVRDMYLKRTLSIPVKFLLNPRFDLLGYFARHARRLFAAPAFKLDDLEGEFRVLFTRKLSPRISPPIPLFAVRPKTRHAKSDNSLSALQRNAAAPRDFSRLIPEPVVVVVQVNEQPTRALVDSGSLSDFMSARLAHQLGLEVFELTKPLPVQLAVQGSRAKINFGCRARLEYQRIRTERYFDVINLLNYDLILGTPFIFQHKVTLGLNPTTLVVGSPQALPIEGRQVRMLQSHAADVLDDVLEAARKELREYAAPICKEASDSPLPPLRTINHRIPLIDPDKVYTWRPSKCPDAHRENWREKRDAYLKSGR
ncbi:hypothetical protein DICSQDRAFT_175052 [Dichomitus squalens LYAD-421 SS1]|uniref:Aspartic peptidase DDI1-type domain-containing protein n=1 Tax=Dichomitus squalens (strain LYAD-421) TaxID=732165 RepID=R7SKK1_DICSQ|nr:uncharacterized protein DICSQDRAFT_175052 [Dichomitus squalens LYAD-421 SS1]EJF56250.1 hypothetical protein DICSQDRAFT_175052 [Dichomitus squalens LYAD-421 SS1]